MNLFHHYESALPYDGFLHRYGTESQRHRWNGVLEQVQLPPSQTEMVQGFTRRMPILILAGAWCGDCASQCPIFERLARLNPLIEPRYLDRDEHMDVQHALTINGGNRVPVAVFFSEDGFEVARYGERTLSKYRELVRQQVGASCATGIVPANDPMLAQVTQDWLNEVERVQWILRLSPRLRQRHSD
ncbi:thioredoxin family protein [Tuwongella immobilis]|uniref:Thioredoxin domain-containing protein n=1 Tax=Tuwongella immobilis TaxID=692036 RepID=A0A6C2YJ11_9BACT|nr:thioredoxin family protein [Tuwongella immobilis]VIP01123.1 Uncharacterized protein OS=Singulisphaera acidiphila (strain ATCC BAA-1392 / DSM 18658 / VKM B-2454 / MOB10) GN=Sinac_0142 PE=4 SV=1: Thioredoxin_9 [Tuwongella immobilis]VTR97671.1 Uncharacterized protein OS=Singulisphaera acidiphila (strain ATCC BAA-1392 / DSM 18658 / VKM B-2454 / MOB10) GN=Sinac_0142 PE=4 SV=1: Thioredoxin_9 [Tuwongella immobilis]